MACEIDDELHAIVKGVVDELEAAASGSLYDVDGEYAVIDDLDVWKDERFNEKAEAFMEKHPDRDAYDHEAYDSYDEWLRDEIGDVDEPDSVSLDEYVEKRGLGDTRFEVDTSMQLSGGRTLFCYGGPNVWVHDDEVRGYWGASQCAMSLDSETRSALWDWFESYWDAIRG